MPKKQETPARFDVFLPFQKVEEIDGAVYVSSRATREELDTQDEIVGIDASVKAFTESSEWFERVTGGASKGNVRAMHQAIAAGKMLAWYHDEEDDAIDVDLKVVDAEEGKKCREHVYVGVSIGGIPKAWETVKVDGKKVRKITQYDLVEISLVDRPACPSAVFSVVKRAEPSPAPKIDVTIPPEVLAAKRRSIAAEKAEKEPTTVQTLIFDKEKFSVEEAKAWADDHGFKSSKVDEPEDGKSIRLRQKDPADFQEDMKTITLKPGVQAVVGHLKVATPRFGKILEAAAPEFQKRMQGIVLFPVMDALRSLEYALEALGYDAHAGEDVQADLGTLTGAVEGLLEFMAVKFRDQLLTATSAKGDIREKALTALEWCEALTRSLNPLQLQKVLADEDMKENLDAIHTMGHGLVKASTIMGATCKANECVKQDEEEEETDGEEAAGEEASGDGEGSGQEEGSGQGEASGEEEEAGGKKPPQKKKVAAPTKGAPAGEEGSVGIKEVLEAVAKVSGEVGSMREHVKSLDDRVKKIAALPAQIGRSPAQPVEKVLGPGAETVSAVDEAAILKRLADAEPDSERKRILTLCAVEASVKAAQKAAGR